MMVENYDIPIRQGRSSTFDSLVAPAVMLRQPATMFAKQKKRLERPSSAVLFKQKKMVQTQNSQLKGKNVLNLQPTLDSQDNNRFSTGSF